MNQPEYKIAANLLQAIVNNLNSQPAGAVRELLNAIESTCSQQDKERADAAAAAERAAIEADVKGRLEAALDHKVHASAQPLPEITGVYPVAG